MVLFNVFGSVFLVLISAFVVRVVYLLYKIISNECNLTTTKSLRTVICIGSGGHTTELLRLMRSINYIKYSPRLYILAENDSSSEVKIHEIEKGQKTYKLARIPRSRNVQQSYHSSIFSTIYATLYTVPLVYGFKPNVVFCNGPGTCIPVCIVAFFLRCFFLIDCRIVFVESVCRVRTLSLTGKILTLFADLIIVQWPELRDACFRAKYFGRLT